VRDSFDVLIVGAGIAGAACAYELASAGASVGVLECDAVGSGATAAGMGHIVVMDDSPAQLALTRYSQKLWDAFVQDAPARHEYTCCGTIWVAADDGEMQAAHRKHTCYAAHGVRSDLLDEHALYTLEPNLRPGLAGGLLVPGDSVVYPPGSAALFLERAAQCGARLRYGRASRLVPDGVLLSDGAVVKGGAIVIATGARAVELVPEAPIRTRKGHLAITDRYPGFVRHQLVELGYSKSAHAASGDSVAFNVQPRCTGQVLIGCAQEKAVAAALKRLGE
jgi:glycine/D-amino acid oxidase-like deaminating enzyme